MPTVSREYKDRLFNFIFGSEENKAWTLNLYNAVNGTSYTDPGLISINTIFGCTQSGGAGNAVKRIQ